MHRTQGGDTREETCRYTGGSPFLSMSSSTNGLGLREVVSFLPCKNDTGVVRQWLPVAQGNQPPSCLSFVTAHHPGSLELEGLWAHCQGQ